MPSKFVNTALIALTAVTLTSCGTVYQKKSMMTGLGYSDVRLGEGRYRITYEAAAASGEAKAIEFWHRRAAELCGSSAYEHKYTVTIKDHQQFNRYNGRMESHLFPTVHGSVVCKTS